MKRSVLLSTSWQKPLHIQFFWLAYLSNPFSIKGCHHPMTDLTTWQRFFYNECFLHYPMHMFKSYSSMHVEYIVYPYLSYFCFESSPISLGKSHFQALTTPINRAGLETKSQNVSFWSLIPARSAIQWIEADPILWPTQHGIQRTAGVMASLWHNQKKKENTQKACLFWVIFLFSFAVTTSRHMCHFPDRANKLCWNIFCQLWNIPHF